MEKKFLNFDNLRRGEYIAAVGGVLLAIAVFLPWFELGNGNAHLEGAQNFSHHPGLGISAWQALVAIRFLLLLGAIAPWILGYIILRDHALSWPRGELTAVVAITAMTLVLVRGLIIKPGNPHEQIHLSYGWYLALFAGVLMLVGALTRVSESERVRKPPGVI
ncbi:MAG TPA: hypothetical protein VHE14_01915 [Solirubrobacteraceae bacterium]|nr:hypothetical protein [Solirubrobacteraceae bacterium]